MCCWPFNTVPIVAWGGAHSSSSSRHTLRVLLALLHIAVDIPRSIGGVRHDSVDTCRAQPSASHTHTQPQWSQTTGSQVIWDHHPSQADPQARVVNNSISRQ